MCLWLNCIQCTMRNKKKDIASLSICKGLQRKSWSIASALRLDVVRLFHPLLLRTIWMCNLISSDDCIFILLTNAVRCNAGLKISIERLLINVLDQIHLKNVTLKFSRVHIDSDTHSHWLQFFSISVLENVMDCFFFSYQH